MGEMSSSDEPPVPFEAIELSKGWSFRRTDENDGDWLSVKVIPSTVHQDLIDNHRCVDLYCAAACS